MIRGKDWKCPSWCKKADFRTGKTPRYKFLSTSLNLELPKYYLSGMPTSFMGVHPKSTVPILLGNRFKFVNSTSNPSNGRKMPLMIFV